MKKANPNGVAKSSVKHVKPNPNAKPGKYFREDPLERIPEGYGSYSGNTSVRSVQHPEWVENSFRRPLERLAYETTVDMYPLLAVPAKFGGSAAYEWAERQGVQIVEKHSRRGGKFAEFAKDYKFSASKGKANAKTSKLPDGPDLEMVDADGSTNTPTRDSSRRQPSSSRSMAVQVSRKRKSSASAGMSARSAAMFGSRTGAYRSKSTGPYARRGAKGGYTKGRSTRVALGAGRTLPWKVRGKMMPIAFITAGNDMPDGTATSGTAGAMALPSDFILNTVVQSTTPAGGAVTQGFYWCPKLSDFSAANEMAAIADSYCINKATMKLMPSINSASAAGATLPTLWCIPDPTGTLYRQINTAADPLATNANPALGANTTSGVPQSQAINAATCRALMNRALEMNALSFTRLDKPLITKSFVPTVTRYEMDSNLTGGAAQSLVTTSYANQWINVSTQITNGVASNPGLTVPHCGYLIICEAPQSTQSGNVNCTIQAYVELDISLRTMK